MNCIKIFVTSLFLTVIATITAIAGQWKFDDYNWKKWYQRDDGTYPVNQWEKIDGNWFYFDEDGWMMTNSWTPDGYYVGADGAWSGQSVNSNFSQTNSISFMTSSGTYSGMTIFGDYEAYIHDIEINGDILTLKGTMYYDRPQFIYGRDSRVRMQEGVYYFQLYSGTEYGLLGEVWQPKSKAFFEQEAARGGLIPGITIVVENGVVSSFYFSA